MANADTHTSANLKRCSGITLTLPKEYRPKYKVTDPLLQSSAEQTPLNLSLVVENFSPRQPSAASRRPSNQPPADPAAHIFAPTIAPGLATGVRCQSPTASWTYCPSQLSARSEVFHTNLRQRGHQHRGRGPPRRGHSRGRNDIFVGRADTLPIDWKSLTRSSVGLNQNRWHLKSPKCPMDFFMPMFDDNTVGRAFQFDKQSTICTTWRGLSSMGAEELFAWTNVYDRVMKERRECGRLSANLCGIAVEMVKRYEQRPPMGLNWFSSATNIYQRVEKFLSMSTETPTMQIEELELPVAGQGYGLAPRVLNISDDFGSGLAREAVFSTSAKWLSFDPTCNVFRGIMPFTPPRSIIVKAKVVDHLDERVRLEHVVRTRVNLSSGAEISADKHLSRIFADHAMESKIVRRSSRPRKQVSFADEHETDSLHSSPDHLRSFFNELAALTCDPAYGGSPKELALATKPSIGVVSLDDVHIGNSGTLAQPEATLKSSEEILVANTSCGKNARVAMVSRRHGVTSASSSSQLYPHLRRTSSQQSQSTCEEMAPESISDLDASASEAAPLNETSSCARRLSEGGHHGAWSTWNKPSSVLCDADTNLDLEVALESPKSNCGSVNYLPEPFRPKPVIFQNRFGSLSRCSSMDHPTKACEPASDSDAESRNDDFMLLEDSAFGLDSSMTETGQFKGLPNYEDLWNDLCQWNWKGWEMEANMKKRFCSKPSNSGLSLECSEASLSSLVEEEELGTLSTEDQGSKPHSRDDIQDERSLMKDQSPSLGGSLHPLTLSSATTNTPHENCSDTSWPFRDDVPVLKEVTNSATKSVTLYETVRKQFYKDHRVRQLCCPSHSTSSSTRAALSSLFSSSSDRGELTDNCPQALIQNTSVSPGPGNESAIAFTTPTVDRVANLGSLASIDQRETDTRSIAAAVQKSLETEVQGQDTRESAEIREGVLHHQVMELRRSGRQRDFGSSDYGDIFWSSEEGNGVVGSGKGMD